MVINGIGIEQDSISVQLSGNIKQCRPYFNVYTVKFQPYSRDSILCVCEKLQQYLARIEKLRQGISRDIDRLLISYIKPHKAVTKDTTARWIKPMLSRSGVDTKKYTAASVGPATASKATAIAVPTTCITAKAVWSQESTFPKYYDKHIITAVDLFRWQY